MDRAHVLATMLALGCVVPAATADALTLTSTTGRTASGLAATRLDVVAAPGQRNDVVVSQQPDAAVAVRDPGATLRTQTGACVLLSAHEARCAPPEGDGIIENVVVDLGDGDDRGAVRHEGPVPTRRPIVSGAQRPTVNLTGGAGNDDLTAGAGFDALDGGPGDDLLHSLSWFASIDGGAGADRIDGENGTWHGRAGDDVLRVTGTRGVDAHGGEDDDVLLGGDGPDGLDGGGGRDLLRGGPGDDSLTDGDGRSLQLVPVLGLTTRPVDADDLDGGSGSDEVRYSFRDGPVTVDLRQPGGHGETGENDRIANVENASGGPRSRLTGTDGPNRFSAGNAPGDVIRGLGGNDTIRGVSDGDVVDAGSGDDEIHQRPGRERARRPARIRCGAGTDTVAYPVAYLTVDPACERNAPRVAYVLRGPLLQARADGSATGLAFTYAAFRRNARPALTVRVRLRSVTRTVHRTWAPGGYALGSSAVTEAPAGRTVGLRVRLGPRTRRRLARAGRLPLRLVLQARQPASRRWSGIGSFVTTVRAAVR